MDKYGSLFLSISYKNIFIFKDHFSLFGSDLIKVNLSLSKLIS